MVLITIKTLQQQTFKIEIDPEETVKTLKSNIEKDKGDAFPVAGQKLIYAGKILEDDKKVSDYKIQEKDFLVVMVTKPKAPSPAKKETQPAQESAPATAPEDVAKVEEKEKKETQPSEAAAAAVPTLPKTESTPTSTVTTTSESTPTSSSNTAASGFSTGESNLVTGQEFEDMVKNIKDLGFSDTDVRKALRLSFHNPERAVQYLIEGYDLDVLAEQQQISLMNPGAGGQATTDAGSNVAPPSPSDDDDPLAFLENEPDFINMRNQIRANPNLLPVLLQQLRGTNQELFQLINQNQARFVNLINSPSAGSGAAPASGGGGGGIPQQPQPGEQFIQVSPEDKAAIDRLKQLGFSEGMVVQVYFACDKNEELAANYLLNTMDDD